jgi:hypothetical protein
VDEKSGITETGSYELTGPDGKVKQSGSIEERTLETAEDEDAH